MGLGFSAAGDGFAGFFVGGAAALGFALVPLLFAAGDGEFDFHFAAFEVHARGNQRQAALLSLAEQFADFFAVREQFSRAKRGMVRVTAVLVGADVAVQEPELSVLDQAIGVLEIGLAGADGFDLGAGENDSDLEFIEQEIVVPRVPVNGGISLSGGSGLPAGIFLAIRLRLMGSLLRHR